MRRVLLIDRPVDEEALAEADALGASEVIQCDGLVPPALADLALGFHELADEPPARRLLPKSVVTARLRTLGKFADAWTALLADGDKFDKWFSPDWPNVYADDDGLIAFLEGLGLTPAETDTVTAP